MFKLSVKFHNSGFDLMMFFVGCGRGRFAGSWFKERKATKTLKILRERNVKIEMGRKKCEDKWAEIREETRRKRKNRI